MFECDKCGLCCIGLEKNDLMKEMHNGDGICRNLDIAAMSCKIYEQRPIFCRVEEFYDTYLTGKMEKGEFMRLNHEACLEKKKAWEACGGDIHKMCPKTPEIDANVAEVLMDGIHRMEADLK